MAFRQLIAADNCGVPNPLAGLAGNGGQLAADARTYGPAGKAMGGGVANPGVLSREVLQAHHPRESEMIGRMGPAIPQGPSPQDQMRMVAEFEAMRLAADQQMAHAQAADWELSFQQQQHLQQQKQHHLQQQHRRQIPGLHPQQQQAMLMGTQGSMMGLMGAPGLPLMGYRQPTVQEMAQQQYLQQQHLQQQLAAQQQAVSVDAQAPQPQQVQPQVAPAGTSGPISGGVDLEAMRQLRESGDEKFQNSKFLRFVDDINSGALRFDGNQVVPGEGVAADDWKEAGPADDSYGYPLMQDGAELDLGALLDEESGPEGVGARLQARMLEQARGGEYGEFLQQLLLNPDAEPGDLFVDMLREKEAQKQPAYRFLPDNDELSRAQEAAVGGGEQQQQQADGAFERGVQLFDQGEVTAAIRAFEAAVQLDPEHSEAWRYLGQAHAENDSNGNAIAALSRCIEIDPYNLQALMMLGVSYQNDLKENQALQHLRTWLLNNPDLAGIGLEEIDAEITEYQKHYAEGGGAGQLPELGWGRLGRGGNLDNYMHNQVAKMFRHALQHRQGDADLHAVMGVLLHLSDDFELAVEEFKAALRIRPDDASLWSKLGATLANGDRFDQALPAYDRSLALRPNSVRVLVNQGVSLANQGMHKPAALAYIQSLEINPQADRSWSYLRISLSHLADDRLMQLVDRRDLAGLRAALA